MKNSLLFLFILIFGLTSCVQIIDDIALNLDGSGTFKYSINLSSSKVKVGSILALDSLNGQKVPKLPEIKTKVTEFKTLLAKQPGISNVKMEANYDEYIIKLECDFTDVNKLQEALKSVVSSMNNSSKSTTDYNHDWISWNGNKLNRSIPDISLKRLSEIKQSDLDLLKTGSYTTISRFSKIVEKSENPNSTISKSGSAVMLKANAFALVKNPKILENNIYLNQK